MVGVSDIPIVGKAVEMISEATVKAAYRGLRYMFCCKDLVNDLNSKIEKITTHEDTVSNKVVEEQQSGKIVEDHVYKWQKEVKEIKEDSENISAKYKNRRPVPPNPLSHFRLGREAVQKAKKVAELMESGNKLVTNPIARLPPVENLPKNDSVFQIFQSRKDSYDKLWQSLITEGSPRILGIYGLPGVGKTRIAEQIWKEAKEKGIFNKVTKAVVSSEKDLDVKRLQNELANDLNCRFESQDDIKHRASQLNHSIMYEDKVLVILDDVWREIPLHDIGIPIDDDTTISKGGCKILFTSRKKKVCLDNNCIDPVEIRGLTDVEAWDMFKDSVGTVNIQDEYLARQVCKKCGGLPLLIRAVGKALRNTTGHVWKDALDQLQKYKIECVPGIDPGAYACLKLSFDNLVEDAQACLLMGSLCPEDTWISIRTVIELGIGSKLLPGGRSRVLSMVDILRSSCLIFVDEFTNRFKLHDIIRDVARSIAIKDKAFLFARSDSSLPRIDGIPKLVCLEVNKNNFNFPRDMVYHGVHTLWIKSISIQTHILFQVWEVAGTFVNLECLILRNIEWAQQSPPVEQLGKLKTLVLDQCDISKTDFGFISENLETFCVWDCDLPVSLDLLNLKYLRKLEIITQWGREVVLVANTISSLSSLEELHIPCGYTYQKQQDDDDDDEVNNSSISMEISKLTYLKSLQMTFKVSERIQDPKLFSNLSEFGINVGENWMNRSMTTRSRWISLCGNQLEAAFVSLIKRTEVVVLVSTDVDVSSIFNSNREAFSDLKDLIIRGSDIMEHLARIPHHQIQPPTSFCQLTKLNIEDCSKMKYLFCNSVAKCLVQLKDLFIRNCTVMEAIILNEGSSTSDGKEDIIMLNFSKLEFLTLIGMPKLRGFNIEKKDMHCSSTVSLKDNSAAIPTLSLFSEQVAFPALEELFISNLTVSDIWEKYYYNDNASSFGKLKRLEVLSCTKLENVIPFAMLHKLGNLETLGIKDCSSVVSETGTDSNKTAVPLVALTDMFLEKLPSMINTWLNSIPDHSQAIILYPNLKRLRIRECNSLSNVFLPSIAGDLMHLADLYLDSCEMMTEIIRATAGDNISKDVLPNLVTCRIMYCDKIKLEDIEFWGDDSACQLKFLDLRCDKEMQLPNTWQLQISNLEVLTLGNCWWHEQIFPRFSKLRQLIVTKSGCSTLFPFSVISSLQQLEAIEISDSAFLKDIVEDVRGNGAYSTDKKIIEFIQLKTIVLKDLPKLGSFMSGADYECHMPALSIVEIDNCVFSTLFPFSVISSLQQLEVLEISNSAFLKDIVEDVRGNGANSTDKKIIEFIQLKKVVLKNLPNLRTFMCGADYECHMPALSTVKIDNCVFSTLFTCCGNLQQLHYLQVQNCSLMEHIVKDTKNDEISAANVKIITLARLFEILLKNLPNLRSFGRTSSYAFDMPTLCIFRMLRCPQVENFTYLKTSTRESVYVTSDWHGNGKFVSDLNEYIEQNCKRGSNIISDSAEE